VEFIRAEAQPVAGACPAPRARLAVASRRALLGASLLTTIVSVGLIESVGGEHSRALIAVRAPYAPIEGSSSPPPAAQGIASATLGVERSDYRVVRSGAGFQAHSPAQNLHVRFSAHGVQIGSGALDIGLNLRAVGYGAAARPPGAARLTVHANRVTYTRAGVSEWYVNGPLGLEQGFTIWRAPPGHPTGPMSLSIELSGNAHASLAAGGQSVALTTAAGPTLSYGGLVASDARGRTLHSWLALHDRQLVLSVDARGVVYPLSIDPLVQKGSKSLNASDERGSALFGESVALSSDGGTALVGGPCDGLTPQASVCAGAAWVFARTGANWAQQGPKLTGGGSGECKGGNQFANSGAEFGKSVALSADGNTALIGGPRESSCAGAVWVFTRSGSTWKQQGSKLTGGAEIGGGRFGYTVALSSDGNTALIGGHDDNGGTGAAWVFTRSGSTWTQQNEKLTGGGAVGLSGFGSRVALSSDGSTALISGPADNEGAGAAWVFTRSATGTWTRQEKLTGGGETGRAFFGDSVAFSADGNTALIGGDREKEYSRGYLGAAWVFTRSGSTWTQQGEKLTSCPGGFGSSAALSSDGNVALIGAVEPNAQGVCVFARSGSSWTQQGERLNAKRESAFGEAVALSSDARIAMVGAPGFGTHGAVRMYPNGPPVVKRVSPKQGSLTGGTSVKINGVGFIGASGVRFGSAEAASFTVEEDSSIVAVSPAGTTGVVDVTVTDPIGTSALTARDHFGYK
jgi:hypothetical protein